METGGAQRVIIIVAYNCLFESREDTFDKNWILFFFFRIVDKYLGVTYNFGDHCDKKNVEICHICVGGAIGYINSKLICNCDNLKLIEAVTVKS